MYFELFLQVIGVAQVINKRGFLDHTFTREDEKVLKKTGLILLFIKVARYSFSGSIPPKFEHRLRHQKQSFGKIATTVVLDKDENLF